MKIQGSEIVAEADTVALNELGVDKTLVGLAGFDWSQIATWIGSHLPQILQILATLLTTFITLA